ncbi:MAG: hypothetical protein JNK18_02895 [Cyclobacteriaceae bacterium]|nr:hypothetical protein [Cyclobacteriaceae bacterium]
MKIFLCGCFLFFGLNGYAQTPQVKLSQKHFAKIQDASSIKEKLKRYRKYYRKDSTRQAKRSEKQWQAKSDSVFASLHEGRDKAAARVARLSKRANRKLEKLRNAASEKRGRLDSLNGKPFVTARLPDNPVTKLKHRLPNKPVLPNHTGIPRDDRASGSDPAGNLPKLPVDTGRFDLPTNLPINPVSDTLTKADAEQLAKQALQNPALAEATGDMKAIAGNASGYRQQATDLIRSDSTAVRKAGNQFMSRAPQQAGGLEEVKALKDYKAQTASLDPTQNTYVKQVNQLQDTAYQKEQARKKAEELAAEYLANNPSLMKPAQAKMDVLMKKFSAVPNSHDLSTAVKRTSLGGKSFKQRLYIAANFQVLSFKPVAFDFSPVIGYRINTRWVAGTGIHWRKTFDDSLAIAATNALGYKVFTSYDIFRNFFAYAEFSHTAISQTRKEGETLRTWQPAALAGLGRKFTLHPKLEMTVVVLYNFIHDDDNRLYTSPWIIRFGFQASRLVFFKKKPTLTGY